MAVTRYTYRNPWRELDQLGNRLASVLDWSNGGSFPTPSSAGTWAPAVSVEETDGELILTAELPGMKPEDVELHVENNILTIRGEKREERTEQDEGSRFHVWERSYGAFQRSFTLPRTVQSDDIKAEFENGLTTRASAQGTGGSQSAHRDRGWGRASRQVDPYLGGEPKAGVGGGVSPPAPRCIQGPPVARSTTCPNRSINEREAAAKTDPGLSANADPSTAETRPPASSMMRAPAAKSQGFRKSSQNPSSRPSAI